MTPEKKKAAMREIAQETYLEMELAAKVHRYGFMSMVVGLQALARGVGRIRAVQYHIHKEVEKMNIDRKFEIDAVSIAGGNEYDQTNSVLFLARDPALLPAILAYRGTCWSIGCGQLQLDSIDALYQRVKAFQEKHGIKLPEVETAKEFDRLTAPEPEPRVEDVATDPTDQVGANEGPADEPGDGPQEEGADEDGDPDA